MSRETRCARCGSPIWNEGRCIRCMPEPSAMPEPESWAWCAACGGVQGRHDMDCKEGDVSHVEAITEGEMPELTPELEAATTLLWRLREAKFHDALEAEIRAALRGPNPLAAITAAANAEAANG